jgi:hypothetical protein
MSRLLLLAALLVAAPASAESVQNLPDWAAPSAQAPAPAADATSLLPPDPPAPPPPVPVDGGLTLLALAGAGYAAKRLRARRED